MDKHGRRFIEDNNEPTRIIDLDDSNVKDDWDDSEDIDTLYEQNEKKSEKPVDEPTKVIRIDDSSKKKVKNKSAKKETKEKENKEEQKQERLKEKNAKKLEKLMKKQQKREKNSDREVLSYEDMPLEERENSSDKKPKIGSRKRFIAVILVIVIVFGAVFIFASSDRLSWHNIRNYVKYGILNQKSDENFPISIHGENVDVGNFARMGQDVCYASDTKLQIINNYGRYEYSSQHGYSNPVMTSCDQYAMSYSLGGNGYEINNYEKLLHVGVSDDRILTADIINNGTYALVTTSNGYLSKMQVYNKENEKIFGYSFADYYVTSVSLAPNGKNAVVTGLSAENGSEISSIYVLDFTKDKPAYLQEVTDNIFYDVQYLSDSYACAVGNSAVCGINTKNGEMKTTRYDGRHLTCYCINSDTDSFSVSLSRSGDGRNCEILSFRNDGSLTDSFETEYMVKYISSYKGRIALLTPDVIYLYTKSGSEVSHKDVTNEPRAVVLYTTSDAYVLDTNEISSLSI